MKKRVVLQKVIVELRLVEQNSVFSQCEFYMDRGLIKYFVSLLLFTSQSLD